MGTNGRVEHEEEFRIPVAYLILGWEHNKQVIIDFFRNARTEISWATDAIQPKVGAKIEWMQKEIADARRRGVRIRQITEITTDNLPECKEKLVRIDELRHLPGLKVVFGFSDIEFLAMVPSLAPREEFTKIRVIQSDSESVLAYKQLIFDALWARAIPAELRIKEIEDKNVKTDAAQTLKTTIDRIHVCEHCGEIFVYKKEAQEHEQATGHKKFREYPLV